MDEQKKKKRRFKVPHTFVILFIIMLVVAVLTYIIPAGSYEEVINPETGATTIDPDSFHYVEQSPTGFFAFWLSITQGLQQSAGIVFFIILVGGAFEIITQTGAIEAGIGRVALKLRNHGKLLVIFVMLLFAVFGSTIGFSEEAIVFIPIGVALARALGYDALVGFAMVILGASAGFSAGFMNPFTVGVAQGIAELPMFSGIGLRLVLFVFMAGAAMLYVLRYGKKVQLNPNNSIVAALEVQEKDSAIQLDHLPAFTTRHKFVLVAVVLGFGVMMYGVFSLGWYIDEIATVFLIIGVLAGLIGGMGPSRICEAFLDGAKGIVFGAVVVGVARAILVIMSNGMIIHTIVHALASAISALPRAISVIGMYIVQCILNFFIPSGSGQAATTMPIMVPLADVLEINRQVAVLAFQLGDGISNYIIPTGGALLAALGVAKIPYEKWVKFVWPLILIWYGIGAVFLIVANAIGYGPF